MSHTPASAPASLSLSGDDFVAIIATPELNRSEAALPPPRETKSRRISFVIPVKNESETLGELCDRIVRHVPAGVEVEIIRGGMA